MQVTNLRSTNGNYSSPQRVAFQGGAPKKIFKPIDQFVSRLGNAKSGETNKLMDKLFFKPISKLIEKISGAYKKVTHFFQKHDFIKEAKTYISFTKTKLSMTREFKSKDINKQKAIIDKMFDLDRTPESLKTKYVSKTLVPYITKTKNRELADYVLKSSYQDNVFDNHHLAYVEKRIKLLKELGAKDQSTATFAELESYMGEQDGIAKLSKNNCPKEATRAGLAAKEALEKLKTNPNF